MATLDAEDLANIAALNAELVKQVTGKDPVAPDPATQLPLREWTPEEAASLSAGFQPGISPEQAVQYVSYRTVQDSAEYINGALAKWGVEYVTQLPDSVQSGSLPLYVRYPGPYPFGPADPLPGETLPG